MKHFKIFVKYYNNLLWWYTLCLRVYFSSNTKKLHLTMHDFSCLCSYLNGFGPLQIGGVQNTLSSLFPKISFGGFRGCIRDITDNGLTYDLLNPLLQVNTELGCKLENNACPDCSGHGYCEPLWTNSICVCDLGYLGPNCNQSK